KASIYFHVGLGKIASKYLQKKVFPNFHGITYVPSRKYYRIFQELEETNAKAILISREFDQQFETEVKKFAKKYPDTHTILFLRRQDSWIASQYRRFAKNGFTGSFTDFIDPLENKGRFRMEDLEFGNKIKLLEEVFNSKPLVIIYDDFLKEPANTILKIANYCNASIDISNLDFKKVHSSYNEKQIKYMQAIAKVIPVNNEQLPKNRILFFIVRLPVLIFRYFILYTALLLPKLWVSKKPLIPQKELEEIKTITDADWEYCLSRAAENTL
ncbi:MAG TPA: hypothetical protein VFM99_08220, partial [Chitinophagales bacterium]|nr:hypothetical protein [Chitinophagales bacterium]